MQEVPIRDDMVRLGQLLQLVGLAESGSHARVLLAEEDIRVNGAPETRRGAQLHRGDVVEAMGEAFTVR
ncbi:MAG TPA: RNA-binding S4 domain-containing protein [Jiangellaceae bacterium]|nr:RNA-binding S4 domain-containing protein [Jiangellaceae bacterium]